MTTVTQLGYSVLTVGGHATGNDGHHNWLPVVWLSGELVSLSKTGWAGGLVGAEAVEHWTLRKAAIQAKLRAIPQHGLPKSPSG